MKKSIKVTTAFSLGLALSVGFIIGCTAATPIEAPVAVEAGKEYGNQLGAVEYVIKPGDNLIIIASELTRASDNWRRIADFNRIQNPASIKVGQTIWIPKDLIPLSTGDDESREVAGHPDAVVNSIRLPPKINPLSQ